MPRRIDSHLSLEDSNLLPPPSPLSDFYIAGNQNDAPPNVLRSTLEVQYSRCGTERFHISHCVFLVSTTSSLRVDPVLMSWRGAVASWRAQQQPQPPPQCWSREAASRCRVSAIDTKASFAEKATGTVCTPPLCMGSDGIANLTWPACVCRASLDADVRNECARMWTVTREWFKGREMSEAQYRGLFGEVASSMCGVECNAVLVCFLLAWLTHTLSLQYCVNAIARTVRMMGATATRRLLVRKLLPRTRSSGRRRRRRRRRSRRRNASQYYHSSS